ncbi:hypothetical protein F7725_022185 [Dissostichus mawsoni]|uniref:Uncharacterized protein n=1 Tax=Dissostichus mawsoni TaxID=36200 RepID=A0A7J5YXD3_DISMA|nr:hypothetical protein F7725_022185 [Dissostichus mawsoni]
MQAEPSKLAQAIASIKLFPHPMIYAFPMSSPDRFRASPAGQFRERARPIQTAQRLHHLRGKGCRDPKTGSPEREKAVESEEYVSPKTGSPEREKAVESEECVSPKTGSLERETAVESEECFSPKTGSPERETAVESCECASQITDFFHNLIRKISSHEFGEEWSWLAADEEVEQYILVHIHEVSQQAAHHSLMADDQHVALPLQLHDDRLQALNQVLLVCIETQTGTQINISAKRGLTAICPPSTDRKTLTLMLKPSRSLTTADTADRMTTLTQILTCSVSSTEELLYLQFVSEPSVASRNKKRMREEAHTISSQLLRDSRNVWWLRRS